MKQSNHLMNFKYLLCANFAKYRPYIFQTSGWKSQKILNRISQVLNKNIEITWLLFNKIFQYIISLKLLNTSSVSLKISFNIYNIFIFIFLLNILLELDDFSLFELTCLSFYYIYLYIWSIFFIFFYIFITL